MKFFMHIRLFSVFLVLGLSVCLTPVVARDLSGGPASVANLVEKLQDAVVNISTVQTLKTNRKVKKPEVPDGLPFEDLFEDFFKSPEEGDKQGQRKSSSLGSGFVIDKEGIIVTNNHVIEGADEIEVVFTDGRKLIAEIIGVDLKTDIAVLKVNSKKELTTVKFGSSQEMRIGDWVMAIGNPFGFGGSVTLGIVSARGRNIDSGPYDNYIQTDAAINRGNSGGPLFNMHGEVIGINTAIVSPTGGSIGIGFSIPAKIASTIVSQLVEFGQTRRGWLGVRIQPVDDAIAESIGLDGVSGALISSIVKGSPVDNGLLLPGDVILTFDGKDVRKMRDLPRIVAESIVGKSVVVDIFRKGKREKVSVVLGHLEKVENETIEIVNEKDTIEVDSAIALGMKLSMLSDEFKKANGFTSEIKGIAIIDVAPGSQAEEKGILPGQIITDVGQEEITTVAEFLKRLKSLRKDGRKNALLMVVDKNGSFQFIPLLME